MAKPSEITSHSAKDYLIRFVFGGTVTVVAGLIAGRAFLIGLWADLPLPAGGTLSIGTPLLFDLGVYFVVIGVVLTIVFSLAEA